MDERKTSRDLTVEQSMELLWAPAAYGAFEYDDVVRFRLLLNHREWCVGLLWSTYSKPGHEAKAGFTWNNSSKLRDDIWAYLTSCAQEGIDAASAYDAVVADTPGAAWSGEFCTFGDELEECRLWMQNFSSGETWGRGAALPLRASQWPTWADPAEFRLHVATRPDGQVRELLASGPTLLLREEGRWWVVPSRDTSLLGWTLVEVPHDVITRYDDLGERALDASLMVAAAGPSDTDLAVEESIAKPPAVIPDNSEWLLIDTTSGWTLHAGATRLVPLAADQGAHLRLLASEALEARIDYASQHGLKLEFPWAAGTPLTELDGDFWAINLDNGDWTLNLADVVLVRATGEGQFDNTEEGCALALAYARRRGQVPRCTLTTER